MKKPKYSVIMPVLLNREEHRKTVEACADSVVESSEDFEFIIVDDGSELDTDFLLDYADTYIRHNPTNKGIAPSWNDGLSVARGEYICIINDDIIVKPGWLPGLARAFEYDKAGVAAPAVSHVPHDAEGIEEDSNWYPGYCYMFSKEVMEEFTVKEVELNRKRAIDEKEQRPGKFDENFVPFNGEDVDMWHRMIQAGFKLFRVWDVEIWHAEGDTIHFMNYDERSKQAIAQFEKKHGFDPRTVYYT